MFNISKAGDFLFFRYNPFFLQIGENGHILPRKHWDTNKVLQAYTLSQEFIVT